MRRRLAQLYRDQKIILSMGKKTLPKHYSTYFIFILDFMQLSMFALFVLFEKLPNAGQAWLSLLLMQPCVLPKVGHSTLFSTRL